MVGHHQPLAGEAGSFADCLGRLRQRARLFSRPGGALEVVPKVSEDSNAWGRLGLLGYGRLRMTSIAEQSRWYAARIEGHRRP